MTEQNPPDRPRSRTRKISKITLFGFLVAIIVFIIGVMSYLRQSPSISQFFSEHGRTSAPSDNLLKDTNQPTSSSKAHIGEQSPGQGVPARVPLSEKSSQQETEGTSSQNEGGLTMDVDSSLGERPAETIKDPAAGDYKVLINELNAFYSHLDQQPYMQTFGLKEPSKVHFSKLLQKLIDNPPVVVHETDDLFTLLKNTAHFFRILDQENFAILKGILDREKKSFEQMLKIFYQLTYHPDQLQSEYSLNIPLDSLYDYAGFFLNTIGGRLYLFRRDSASRMTVSYYSILVIDRANREGFSRHGIDLRPAVDSLIEEIENTGKNLKFKEEYLDNLYDLKEKYN